MYVNKPEYGKAPKYLQRVKAEIVKEDEEINAHTLAASAAAASEAARFRPMPEEERLRLVDELKAKWDDLNSQYQRMAHMVVMDTAGKVQRKERLDKELRKIEAAIDKLDKPVIIHEK